MNILDEDKKAILADKHNAQFTKIPESEEEILKFLDQPHLENQPTEILYSLADKLRERRAKLYPEEEVLNKVDSDMNLGFGDDSNQIHASSSKQMDFEDNSNSNLNHVASEVI